MGRCGRREMPTTPDGFRCWHEVQRLPAGTPVALETGTVAFFVARELTALGCAPLVVDAREVRRKAQRTRVSGGARGGDSQQPRRAAER
jgi:transposase